MREVQQFCILALVKVLYCRARVWPNQNKIHTIRY